MESWLKTLSILFPQVMLLCAFPIMVLFIRLCDILNSIELDSALMFIGTTMLIGGNLVAPFGRTGINGKAVASVLFSQYWIPNYQI